MLDSLANVKARLGITENDYDTFLENQIQMLSDVIEGYCGRKFLMASYVQTFYKEDLTSGKELPLYQYPVAQITTNVS